MIDIFRFLLARKLAKTYGLPVCDILLPTGCDCIFEEVLNKECVTDEYGGNINLVEFSISCMLGMSIPVIGIYFLVKLIFVRCKILYASVIPTLAPDTLDWLKLLYCVCPEAFYFKVLRDWSDEDDSDVWEDTQVSE